MDLPGPLAHLHEHQRAVLAISRADGRPQVSSVVVADADEGLVVITSRERCGSAWSGPLPTSAGSRARDGGPTPQLHLTQRCGLCLVKEPTPLPAA